MSGGKGSLGYAFQAVLLLALVGCGADAAESDGAKASTDPTAPLPSYEVTDTMLIPEQPIPSPSEEPAIAEPPPAVVVVPVSNEPTPDPAPMPAAEPVVPDTSQCAPGELQLSGQLDGEAFEVSWNTSIPFRRSASTGWELAVAVDVAKGFLRLGSDAPDNDRPKDSLADGELVTLSGGLLIRPDQEVPTVYCLGSNSTVQRQGDEVLLDWGLSLLGRCPGEPVSGELLECSGSFDECAYIEQPSQSQVGKLVGNIEDRDLGELAIIGVSFFGQLGAMAADLGIGTIRWVPVEQTPDTASGETKHDRLGHGVYVQNDGAVYCVSDESTYREVGGTLGFTELHAVGFSKLGSCATANETSSSLTGCLR